MQLILSMKVCRLGLHGLGLQNPQQEVGENLLEVPQNINSIGKALQTQNRTHHSAETISLLDCVLANVAETSVIQKKK